MRNPKTKMPEFTFCPTMREFHEFSATVRELPEAEMVQEVEKWIDNVEARLSAEEFERFKSDCEVDRITNLQLLKLAESRGIRRDQKMEDVISKKEFLEALQAALLNKHQQQSDSKH